jgi:hypothetical protein
LKKRFSQFEESRWEILIFGRFFRTGAHEFLGCLFHSWEKSDGFASCRILLFKSSANGSFIFGSVELARIVLVSWEPFLKLGVGVAHLLGITNVGWGPLSAVP